MLLGPIDYPSTIVGEYDGFIATSGFEVPLTMERMYLLQHTEIHPTPTDCECCNTLHKLCGYCIIGGGAIDSHPSIVGESNHGYIGNHGSRYNATHL